MGFELKRKTIFVNEPFIYKDITLYQTDWDILGVKVKIDDNLLAQVPLKKVNTNGRNFWIGTIPVEIINNKMTRYIVVVNNLVW